jgi:phosphopantothenoylcysteine decarboxylase / phosphopantothenate---cysteine ligase
VRFIGNRSSGRMGLAIAAAALARGAEVTLVAANVSLPPPPGAWVVPVQTAAELKESLEREFEAADVLLMAAAPADFRPRQAAAEKIAREGEAGLELDLEPTDDILVSLAKRRRDDQILVGFAAETADGLERARAKLERKGVDAIVLNDVSRSEIGFESAENEVTVVEREGQTQVPIASKEEIAEAILDRVEAIRSERARERAADG